MATLPNMWFQLARHGWPIGQYLIPEGTIIKTFPIPVMPQFPPWPPWPSAWSQLVMASGMRPPVSAVPFDQTTYDLMRQEFAAWQIITHEVLDGITRW